nr:acyl carrier protein [Helicobacter pylori]
MYGIDSWDLSQEEIREYREQIEYYNELLESEFSLENLLRLKGFKEANGEYYQKWLNDSDLQERLQRWKRSRNNIEGSVSALFEKVRSIIADQLGVNASSITLKTEFVKDLNADSLDVVELVMALEEKFDIKIPDEQAEKIVNVGDVVRYIENNT